MANQRVLLISHTSNWEFLYPSCFKHSFLGECLIFPLNSTPNKHGKWKTISLLKETTLITTPSFFYIFNSRKLILSSWFFRSLFKVKQNSNGHIHPFQKYIYIFIVDFSQTRQHIWLFPFTAAQPHVCRIQDRIKFLHVALRKTFLKRRLGGQLNSKSMVVAFHSISMSRFMGKYQKLSG